jgi:hypothetical protein
MCSARVRLCIEVDPRSIKDSTHQPHPSYHDILALHSTISASRLDLLLVCTRTMKVLLPQMHVTANLPAASQTNVLRGKQLHDQSVADTPCDKGW